MVRALLLACLLSGCGAATPTLMAHGPWADSIGFSCECGSQAFAVVSRYLVRVVVRCHECGRTWSIFR